MFKKVENVILFIVIIGAFLIPFMGSSLNISLPSIQKYFALDIVLLSWIPTVFILANAALILPFGRIADIIGRRKVFTSGAIIYTISSFLAAISHSAILLLTFSFFQGVGCSMLFATALAIINSIFPSGKRGKAFGLYITSVYIGLILGPTLGGFLTQNFGWRSIFLFNLPFGLLMIFLIFWKFDREWIEAKGEKFDFWGSIIYMTTVIIMLYGFTIFNELIGKFLVLSGLLGTLIFIKHEVRTKSPIIDINLFKKAVFTFSALGMLILNISTSAMWVLLSLYLQYLKLLTPEVAGIVLVLQSLVVSLLSPFAGALSDKTKTTVISPLGMIITTSGLLFFIFLNENTPFWYIVTGLILVGAGIALFSSPTTNRFMNSVSKKVYGVASATFSTTIYTGQVISFGVMILIFSIYIGNIQITPQSYPAFLESLKVVFIAFSTISFAGILVSIVSSRN